MYEVYLGELLLPVAPAKISFRYGNKNETVTLLDGSEINIIKKPGLAEYAFEMLLPHANYPFAAYKSSVRKSPLEYISKLKEMKDAGKPFLFKVLRGNGAVKYENVKVTLESYSYAEDAEDGLDITVSVKLKEYRDYGPVCYTADASGSLTAFEERASDRETPSEKTPIAYTVKTGDTLWDICKNMYGNGEKYREIAALNGIANPNLIYPGQVIILE